jgi:hypothetical protein
MFPQCVLLELFSGPGLEQVTELGCLFARAENKTNAIVKARSARLPLGPYCFLRTSRTAASLFVVGELLWLVFPTRALNRASKARIPVDREGSWRPPRAYPGRLAGVVLTPTLSRSLKLWQGTPRAKITRPNLGS